MELQTIALEVPALTYAYEALEPYIDAQTMHLHHDKHHKAYVDNANAAIEKAPELKSKVCGTDSRQPGGRTGGSARCHPQ